MQAENKVSYALAMKSMPYEESRYGQWEFQTNADSRNCFVMVTAQKHLVTDPFERKACPNVKVVGNVLEVNGSGLRSGPNRLHQMPKAISLWEILEPQAALIEEMMGMNFGVDAGESSAAA